MDDQHLNALRLRLSHERARLASAKTERERAYRAVIVVGCEREIEGELKLLGKSDDLPNLSDDELANELGELK